MSCQNRNSNSRNFENFVLFDNPLQILDNMDVVEKNMSNPAFEQIQTTTDINYTHFVTYKAQQYYMNNSNSYSQHL
ncbi:uncharacterized protein ASCRUDRAFT_75882 [Ascoidea rubescens DSM 1968]|uniref:Uncharacterized protein n=1 Tax=Ascoidea rubescens DSM 1968 TaxID=1344418 RepID=A0A1D2VHM6_9ASCO|nr:hypothetical protein ASCRUDRAFT_75882 [Ascoidea rubescens DSM 1968]ODV61171.1 hypothetical protein ASCRUDRAFT_75882 [Ascoidea rubescens DSM 1968]